MWVLIGAEWPVAAQWGGGGPPWGWHMGWGAWGVGMLLFMVLFWALVVVGIIVLIRWAFGASGTSVRSLSGGRALAIRKERYAKGELTREQLEATRRDLEG